jgi:hypothetical protein
MKKYPVLITLFLLSLSACWSAPNPSLLEPETPVISNPAGYTGLQDETLEFNLTATSNSKKPRAAVAVKSQNLNTSSLRMQSDFIDVPILKARVIAVKKGKVIRPGQVATTTELTAIFDWSSDTPLTGSVTLNGYHPPEYTGAWSYSSVPETGQINTTKTNQNAPGFTGNTFKSKQPGRYECVYASWNLSSGPFQYVQDQPVKLCKQPVKTDYRVTLTGPRAPKVGFVTEYEIKTSQSILSAGVLNPVLKIFVPEHTTFQGIRWGTYGGGNPFSIQCNPETPAARVILCTGSSVSFAVFTLLVRPSQALAETFRVELSSDIAERNPADNVASLTVQPFFDNTTTDLQVTGNVLTSSSVFVEDSLEQIVTVKNLGPGVAANAFVIAYQSGQAWGSILPELPAVPVGCVFENSTQIKCPLPALAVGEEFSLTVPIRAKAVTTTGNKLTGYVQYQFDTNTSNNFLTNPNGVIVARDPQKEHALEVKLTAPGNAIEGQTHTSTVIVTNHGPNIATSRTLRFSPASLIPVTAPAGCVDDDYSGEILCDLTGMAANTSRTFTFSGTALYQQWVWNLNVSASLTESGNDLNTFTQHAYQYLYVQRDPNTVHSLEVGVTGVQSEYFVGDAVNASITVKNFGPSASPPREVGIFENGLTLNVPAGCNNEGWRIACPIPALAVGATWTQTLTGTATTQTPNGSLEVNLPGHELETYNHATSVYKSFQVRGYVGLFSAAFTPAPASRFNINEAQTFTVVITNSGLYTSVPDILKIDMQTPEGPHMTGATFTGLSGCDPILDNPYGRVDFCPVPAIPVGGSWSFSYTLATPNIAYFRTRAETIGDNERTGTIAYHEFLTQNGLPLTLAWNPDHPLPSSPPGFAFGQSYPFAVNVTNPNTTSKSFSLEVSIPEGGYTFSLGAPNSCSVTTNPATFDPGDYIDRVATCPMTLAAGQTSSLFFSANFPDCNYDPPQSGANCGTTVRIAQVKSRLIGATATPLTKNVKVNQ